MKGMYRFMQEIGSRLTDDLQIKAEAATDFELKVIKIDLLLLGSSRYSKKVKLVAG